MKAEAGGNWRRFDEKVDPTITKQTELSCVSTVGEILLKNRRIFVSQDKIGVPSYPEALAEWLNRFDKQNKESTIWRGFTTDLDSIDILA